MRRTVPLLLCSPHSTICLSVVHVIGFLCTFVPQNNIKINSILHRMEHIWGGGHSVAPLVPALKQAKYESAELGEPTKHQSD